MRLGRVAPGHRDVPRSASTAGRAATEPAISGGSAACPVISIVAAGRVDGRHDLGVAHRAARLGERGHARREADLDRVGERVERVRGARGAGQRRPSPA